MRYPKKYASSPHILDFDATKASELAEKIEDIIRDLIDFEIKYTARINRLHHAYETSARNLLHYVALKRHDLTPIRKTLSGFGLSSLGKSESHVMTSLISVLNVLNRLVDRPIRFRAPYARQVTHEQGYSLLEAHAESLFGPKAEERRGRIMVTLACETAADYGLVRSLVEKGMDCARINCAHDDASVWNRMCLNVRRAEQETGRRCRILMDLAGPKLRTGPLSPGPQVLRLRPLRNALGTIIKPASVWLSDAAGGAPPYGAAVLPILDGWHRNLKIGDTIVYHDARNKVRHLLVTDKQKSGCLATAGKTGYIVPATELQVVRGGRTLGTIGKAAALPQSEDFLLLKPGDTLVLTEKNIPGIPERRSSEGTVLSPATIHCTLPAIFADVKIGERVCIDDGKITGVIEAASRSELRIRIINAARQGSKLRADKGINLPDSTLSVSGLTGKDMLDLAFIAGHADIIALSFVRDSSDIIALHRQLQRLGCSNLGVVLKIETRQALKRLPALLLSAMALHPIGVMIARGDLAVELGFDNLAAAQEEILFICEAAHVPVIWATQVLENLVKFGMPSRAEMSDTAMGFDAECIMLNKGEYVCSAVAMLDALLRRTGRHVPGTTEPMKNRTGNRYAIEGLSYEKK